MPLLKLTNGVSLSYFSHPDERPSPSRPTLVLFPAFFQRADIQFALQIRDVRLAGFNFVGIDVHGHGETTGRNEWNYSDNAQDAAEALKLLGVEKFFVLGTSHGGLTAQEITLRYPESVRGLVLISSTARPFGEEFSAVFRDVLVPGWTSNVPPPDAALVGSFPTTLGAAALPTDAPGSVFGDRAAGQPTVLDGAERTAESVVGLETLSRIVDNWRAHIGEAKVVRPVEVMLNWTGSVSRLPNVHVPVLVVHGVDDPTVSFDRGEQIISLLPDHKLTKLVKLHGKGAHLITTILDIAPEVNATLSTWLNDCIRAGI